MEGTLTGGKKWASGTTTSFLHGSKSLHVQVNGLAFKPSTIVIQKGGGYMYSDNIVLNSSGANIFQGGTTQIVPSVVSLNSPTISTDSTGTVPYSQAVIYNDGFFLKLGASVTKYRWIAFE